MNFLSINNYRNFYNCIGFSTYKNTEYNRFILQKPLTVNRHSIFHLALQVYSKIDRIKLIFQRFFRGI